MIPTEEQTTEEHGCPGAYGRCSAGSAVDEGTVKASGNVDWARTRIPFAVNKQ